MDGDLQAVIDAAMRALVARIRADEHLAAEMTRARRAFFAQSGRAAVSGRGIAEAGERRFCEWFALERESETLGAVPATVPRLGADEALLGSCVGVFAVTATDGTGATARDLQDGTLLELAVPSSSLLPGDLVVGRLFPVGVGRWLPSVAATVFRPGGSLGAAFERDVERLELDRRLQQIELEHLLLRRRAADGADAGPAAPPLEHLEADLDRLLGDSGHSATAISEQMRATARPGEVMGPLLDEIAFATRSDLDALRRVLLEIWNAHHATDAAADEPPAPAAGGPPGEALGGPPGETLGERLVRALDDGLRSHRDVDGLFSDLEAMAGLEPGAADDTENPFDRADDEDDGDAPAGTLAPLVEEYLWETGREEDAATLRTWVELQGNAAVPHRDLEEVSDADLMRLLMHVYLAAAPERRVEVVRGAFAAVAAFLSWAERTQEIEQAPVLDACRGALLDQVERLARAGLLLSRGARPERRPQLLEVVDVGDRGFGVASEESGSLWIESPGETAALLRVGDLVLGAPGEAGFTGPVVVLPRDARRFIE